MRIVPGGPPHPSTPPILATLLATASLALGILAAITLAVGCTQRNPDLCCENDAECTAIGFSSHAPCDLGACVKNECTTAAGVCDDDADCTTGASCVAGTCAACATSANCPTTASPVCDAIAHDCRACVSDGECDSGACDLAAGTCIDPARIRYASPTGNDSQPCSHAQPCSFSRASATVDTDHLYIVLLPGTHKSNGIFDGTTAIVCGSGASLEASNNIIGLTNSATVTLRGFEINQPDPNNGNDFSLINCNNSALTLQDMSIQVASPVWDTISEFQGKSLTIRHSTLQGGQIHLSATDVIIDRSTFVADIQISYNNEGHAITISNSVFDLTQDGFLDVKGTDSSQMSKDAFIYNNTFSNGQLGCGANGFFPVQFTANIFYNVGLLTFEPNAAPDCSFHNNLIFPTLNVTSIDTLMADPLFVNPASHDYHLQPLSPARDASPDDLSDHDHDGVLRPQGGHSDLGAYEYTGSN